MAYLALYGLPSILFKLLHGAIYFYDWLNIFFNADFNIWSLVPQAHILEWLITQIIIFLTKGEESGQLNYSGGLIFTSHPPLFILQV